MREWWLQNDTQKKGWGPFESGDAAWRYLFGRDSSEAERKQYQDETTWYVGFINNYKSNTGEQ